MRDLLLKSGGHQLVEQRSGGGQAHPGVVTPNLSQRERDAVPQGIQQELQVLPVVFTAQDPRRAVHRGLCRGLAACGDAYAHLGGIQLVQAQRGLPQLARR